MSLNTSLPYCSNAGVLQGQFLTLNVTGGSFTVDANGTATLALSPGGVTSITGTTNQVIASASTGAVTLSLPQSIATTSTPTFGGLTLNGALVFDLNVWNTSTDAQKRLYFGSGGDNYYEIGGGYHHFRNSSDADVVTISNAGAVNIVDYLNVGAAATLSTGDISVARSTTTGCVYFGSNVAHYLYFDGTNYNFGGSGNIVCAGSITGNFGTLTTPTSYGSMAINSSTGGYAGIQFSSTTNTRTLMVSNTGGIAGIYDVGSSAWEWYWTNGTLTQGTIPGANVSGAVSLATTVTSTNTTSGSAIDVALINGTSIQYSGNFTAVPSTGVMTAAGGFTVSSDRNKKDNIRLISNAEEIVQSLNGVKFDWKSNGLPSVGVIAQDVEAVLPELVQTDDEGTKSVNYNGLIGVLIEAVKTLTERVAQLEAK
jgi:hypothetical protein